MTKATFRVKHESLPYFRSRICTSGATCFISGSVLRFPVQHVSMKKNLSQLFNIDPWCDMSALTVLTAFKLILHYSTVEEEDGILTDVFTASFLI